MKIFISTVLLVLFFSCDKRKEILKEKSSFNDKNIQIKDSIRRAQELEVINMDLSSKAEDSLHKDLEKFK